jgi:hypothetical protein
VLATVGQTTEGCPYLNYWLDLYQEKDAAHIERTAKKYAPDVANAKTAEEYISIIAQRALRAAEIWVRTGKLSGIPEGVPTALPNETPKENNREENPVQAKAKNGGVKKTDDPTAIKNKLGDGQPLSSDLRSRMESAFGINFSHVRTHTDSTATRLSNQVNARAFTVGNHIAFGNGEYQPGTLLGDTLIAHELAHTIQQSGAENSVDKLETGTVEYDSLERDADNAAVKVVSNLWSDGNENLKIGKSKTTTALRSGLRLQRCAHEQKTQTTTPAGSTVCVPELKDKKWSVASKPILDPKNGCDLRFAESPIMAGMKFEGFIESGAGCNGKIYFVQYVKPNRIKVGCPSSNKAAALCTKQDWGIDSDWPYPVGNKYTVSPGESRRINTEDSPAMLNISDPQSSNIRICSNDEFVTYLVYEATPTNIVPLGWMHWKYYATAWRDTGNCPPTTTSNDCSGWHIDGVGQKVGDVFQKGAMHPTVPLNPKAPRVTPMSLFSNATDCPDTECLVASSGATKAK